MLMYFNRKGIVVGRRFSLETALNIHLKGLELQKPCQVVKREIDMKCFGLMDKHTAVTNMTIQRMSEKTLILTHP